MEAEAVLMMSRSDYGMMPIDEFARRWLLGLRVRSRPTIPVYTI